jgi:hypothetical protein
MNDEFTRLPFTQLPTWQLERLATLVEALGNPEVSLAELATLAWIAGQELATVQNLAAVISRSREEAVAKP